MKLDDLVDELCKRSWRLRMARDTTRELARSAVTIYTPEDFGLIRGTISTSLVSRRLSADVKRRRPGWLRTILLAVIADILSYFLILVIFAEPAGRKLISEACAEQRRLSHVG